MRPEQDILDDIAMLEARYSDVHLTMRHLRRFWQGHMWSDEEQMTRSMVSVFRDLRHGDGSDREPDVKMTLPLIEATVSKFMALLVNPPQISMSRPPIGYAGLRKEETCAELADQNEKFLYGLHARGNVRRHFSRQSWYLPLMGSCFSAVHPDFKDKTVRFVTASPEFAYPVWDAYRENLQAVGFKYEVPVDVAVRQWGPEVRQLAARANRSPWSIARRTPSAQTITVIEWYDDQVKQTLVAGHQVQGVDHNLGYCPWEQTRFYDVPDEDFGKGVIEGNVPLFQKLNMLDSLELQAIIENVFARLVIIDPAMAPEDIDNSAGGVIPVGKGGDVKWIAPPSTTTDLSNSMARGIDFSQKGTHLPPAIYGEGVASSITTGKAQHEATLPTGNIIEYVQGNIADTLESLNEKAIDMTTTIFANRKVVFFGKQFKNQGWAGAIEKPEPFRLELQKGSDLKGWSEHELTFQPLLSMHEKVVMNLQLAGAGLVSKRYQRDAIGIADNDAMQEEIFAEQRFEIQVSALVAQAQAGALTFDQLESAFVALEKGGTPSSPVAPGGVPTAPTPPPGMMTPPGALPPGNQPPDPNAPLAPGTPNPTPDIANAGDMANAGLPPVAAGQPSVPATGEFSLQGAIGDFSRIKKLKGQVWLLGEIVQRGSTDGPVEVGTELPIDKATINQGLPDEYHGKLKFVKMPDGPNEPAVEVGPDHTDGTVTGGGVIPHPDEMAATGAAPVNPTFQDQAALPSFQPPLATNFPAGGFQGTVRS